MIPLREWNSYLRSLYESPNFVENIPNVSIPVFKNMHNEALCPGFMETLLDC